MSISQEQAVRPVRLGYGHLPEVMALEKDAYADPWKQSMFRQEIVNVSSYFWVLGLEDEVIGYGGFWLVVDEAHITKVTIARPYRGRGLGRELLSFLLREAERLSANTARLEVGEHNGSARRLYERLGFIAVGLRRGYYAKTNESAIVMVKVLRGA